MSPLGIDLADGGRTPSDTPTAADPSAHQPATDGWNQWREAEPVIWQIWLTSGDERVCPICGPLANQQFQVGDGPIPPLHTNCRCQRTYHHTEWRLRR